MVTGKKIDNATIAKRIRDTRRAKDITQEELAEKLEISQTQVQRFETGKVKRMDIDILQDYCNALDTTLKYILFEE